MPADNCTSELRAYSREAKAWRTLMLAMGGRAVYEFLDHAEREDLKTFAEALRAIGAIPTCKVGGWLLHALAHWAHAEEQIYNTWDADVLDESFPHGIGFRRYLGAWLASVGRPHLGMTDEDLEAVQEATGVAMLPHPLLPRGRSEFLPVCM
jgi:hypothetical protein